MPKRKFPDDNGEFIPPGFRKKHKTDNNHDLAKSYKICRVIEESGAPCSSDVQDGHSYCSRHEACRHDKCPNMAFSVSGFCRTHKWSTQSKKLLQATSKFGGQISRNSLQNKSCQRINCTAIVKPGKVLCGIHEEHRICQHIDRASGKRCRRWTISQEIHCPDHNTAKAPREQAPDTKKCPTEIKADQKTNSVQNHPVSSLFLSLSNPLSDQMLAMPAMPALPALPGPIVAQPPVNHELYVQKGTGYNLLPVAVIFGIYPLDDRPQGLITALKTAAEKKL